jgi:hypothetical protein
MTEWRRVNPAHEDGAVPEKTSDYALGPGETRAYSFGLIHSTAHPQKTRIRKRHG